jgi:hypothetical protein
MLTGLTDSNGVVAFNDIVPGTYQMQVAKSGYVTGTLKALIAAGAAVQPSVILQTSPSGIPGYPIGSIVLALLVIIAALQLRRKGYRT